MSQTSMCSSTNSEYRTPQATLRNSGQMMTAPSPSPSRVTLPEAAAASSATALEYGTLRRFPPSVVKTNMAEGQE
ncbi:unnamed protein product [Anisakis simplex]|uniref:Uncharacterized protein n=1 Tax=Anisakis simplex TaxID=6269 RepID=A0A0M3J716_ANISI|nr:unnamed protein product [Anisakis simplex]